MQGGTAHWTLNYTGTQSFISALFYSKAQKTSGTFINFHWFCKNHKGLAKYTKIMERQTDIIFFLESEREDNELFITLVPKILS